MFTDVRGYEITAASKDAADACALAMENYSRRSSDVAPQVMRSLEADPDCALANALFGLLMHGAKHVALRPKLDSSLARAKQHSQGITKREQHYVNALEHAANGHLFETVACYEAILADNPTDGFAQSLLQAELFWLGDMGRALESSKKIAPHWNESVPGYSEFLANYAFELEEAGHYAEAEEAGKKAVSLVPENIWATHAVTHVLYMQGRHNEGFDWIEGLQNNWDGLNQMQFHIWWHKSLFMLEQGKHDDILVAYDAWIRNKDHKLVQAMPDLYIDLQNGASILWRLELAGVDVGNRWQEMAELVLNRIDDNNSPFTSAHFAVILAAVGDYDSCDRLIQSMQDFALNDSQTLASHYSKAAIPAALAAVAHRRGDYALVLEMLLPYRQNLWMMGGSHAQQDLFFQILVSAAAMAGKRELVDSLLSEIEQIGFVEPAQRAGYRLIQSQL